MPAVPRARAAEGGIGTSIADDLVNAFNDGYEKGKTDAVPVVRCKECKHFKRDIPCVGGTYNGCEQLEGTDGCEPYVEEDFFCAYGEKKDNEVE